MKYAAAKKVSTQECYNNELRVVSLHGNFDDALYRSGENDSIITVYDNIKVGDSINDSGKIWSPAK